MWSLRLRPFCGRRRLDSHFPGAGVQAGPGSPEGAVALGSNGQITPVIAIIPVVCLSGDNWKVSAFRTKWLSL
jgi:hypothetical protein